MSGSVRDRVEALLAEGDGVPRLDPAWVARAFLPPRRPAPTARRGRSPGAHPGDRNGDPDLYQRSHLVAYLLLGPDLHPAAPGPAAAGSW